MNILRNKLLLGYSFIWLSSATCFAVLDQDGDGVSDIWSQMFPGLDPAEDSDFDGFSNFDEAVSGTDPGDRGDCLAITFVGRNPNEDSVELRYEAKSGKSYSIESYDQGSEVWTSQDLYYAVASGTRLVHLESSATSRLFRLRVSDVDGDGDGLSGWEESLLGYDDSSSTGSGGSRRDYSMALRALEGDGSLMLADGSQIARRAPQRNEVARFLVQASFGADAAMVDAVTAQGIGPWLDQQFALPATSTHAMMQANGQGYDAYWWRKGWWRSVMLGEDQLRQRMGFALSQIFVINCDTGSVIGDNPYTQGRYYDMLLDGSFGSFREVLEDVSYSTQMGFYLSHLRNRKGNPAVNRFPDENFAREIMQLFSIGLWELNPDGSRKLDEAGAFIPTYDNGVITEMAKVFTGLGFSRRFNAPNNDFFAVGSGNDYQYPMKMFDSEHEQGVKQIVNGFVIPDGQTGDQDIDDALNALAEHPNVGPFIGRFLIQRFTSSNPSPDYIRRVSEVWADNGSGERGDLQAVVEAILLDPEARTPESRGDASGKVREPLLRLTGFLRAFTARNSQNTFPMNSGYLMEPIGQFALLSPSVFNFFSPDHQPAGEMRARVLVAPELEIATTSRLLLTDNLLRTAVDYGYIGVEPDFSMPLSLADDSEALLDYLDDLLTWGSMSDATKATIQAAVDAQLSPLAKVKTAVHLILETPDFVVLK